MVAWFTSLGIYFDLQVRLVQAGVLVLVAALVMIPTVVATQVVKVERTHGAHLLALLFADAEQV